METSPGEPYAASRLGQGPQRLCIVCRQLVPRSGLVRLRRAPGGKIVWSATPPGGGKGMYVCREGPCVAGMFAEKRLRRTIVESMEEECKGRLRALLPESAPFQVPPAGPEEGKA